MALSLTFLDKYKQTSGATTPSSLVDDQGSHVLPGVLLHNVVLAGANSRSRCEPGRSLWLGACKYV